MIRRVGGRGSCIAAVYEGEKNECGNYRMCRSLSILRKVDGGEDVKRVSREGRKMVDGRVINHTE